MKNRYLVKIGLLSLVIALFSCQKEPIDLSNVSDQIVVDRLQALPLAYGSFSIEELLNTDDDTLIVVDGDTLKLVYTDDTVFTYSVDDLAKIPEQDIVPYVISPSYDIPLALIPGDTIEIFELRDTTEYDLKLTNSMRLDSIYLNTGRLAIEVRNSFELEVFLKLSTGNLRDEQGNTFDETVHVLPNQTVTQYYNLDDYVINLVSEEAGKVKIDIILQPIVVKVPGADYIYDEDSIVANFSLQHIDDFEALFGFMGFFEVDTVVGFDFDFPKDFDGLSGTFNVTNPKINLIYDHNFGLGLGADLAIYAHHSDKPDVLIDPVEQFFVHSDNYLSPDVSGQIQFNRNTVSNIDEIISFPIPDSISIGGLVRTNPGADSLTTQNFILGNSFINLGLEVEVPMEFRADLTYERSIDVRDLFDEETTEDLELEFFKLHYWFENQFPLGVDAKAVLRDSVNNVVYSDTLFLNANQGQMFIAPAPVDNNGLVELNKVQRKTGYLLLNKGQADFMLKDATHIDIIAKLQTTNISSVRILNTYSIDFQFGSEFRLRYTGSTE